MHVANILSLFSFNFTHSFIVALDEERLSLM